MPPTVPTEAASATRRIWPITTMIVLVAFLVMAFQLYACALLLAMDVLSAFASVFEPDWPLAGDYISAGMACLTTLPAFAAMIWCGWQRGSRLGLLLISGPAGLMALLGLNLLSTPALTSVDHQRRRSLSIADLFVDVTWVNWGIVILFAGVAMATQLLRQRARRTAEASAA